MTQNINFGYCGVCFENQVHVWMLDCGHVFCCQCILTWYKVSTEANIPPLCPIRCYRPIREDTVKEIAAITTDPALLDLIPPALLPRRDPRQIDFDALLFNEPVVVPITFRYVNLSLCNLIMSILPFFYRYNGNQYAVVATLSAEDASLLTQVIKLKRSVYTAAQIHSPQPNA